MNNRDRLNKIHEKLANLRSENVVPVPQSRMFVAWYWAGDYTLGPTGLVKIPVHLHRYNCGSKTGLTQRDQRWDKSGDPETSMEAYVFDGRTWTFGLALAALSEIYVTDMRGMEVKKPQYRKWQDTNTGQNFIEIVNTQDYDAGYKLTVKGNSPFSLMELSRMFITTEDGADLALPFNEGEAGRVPLCELCPSQLLCYNKNLQAFGHRDFYEVTRHRQPEE